MKEPDLFAEAEPRTCGNCAECIAARSGGHFCDVSKKTVRETDSACETNWTRNKEGK